MSTSGENMINLEEEAKNLHGDEELFALRDYEADGFISYAKYGRTKEWADEIMLMHMTPSDITKQEGALVKLINDTPKQLNGLPVGFEFDPSKPYAKEMLGVIISEFFKEVIDDERIKHHEKHGPQFSIYPYILKRYGIDKKTAVALAKHEIKRRRESGVYKETALEREARLLKRAKERDSFGWPVEGLW